MCLIEPTVRRYRETAARSAPVDQTAAMADAPKLGTDFLTDLPMPEVASWPIFPFEGEISVRKVFPFAEQEHVRSGDPGGPPCPCSGEGDFTPSAPIWKNDTWQVRPIGFGKERAPFPAYMLETLEHLDFDDFDEALAAELGVMTLRLDRAMRATDDLGRVHVNRWGDGGSHYHLWFLGRPKGAGQLSGFALPWWGFILPGRTPQEQAASDAGVAAALSAAEIGSI